MPVAQAETLRILNWEYYLAPEVASRWRSKTGVDIEWIYFDNDDEREMQLAEASQNGIDVAVVDEVASLLMGKRGLFSELTPENAPNVKFIDEFWQTQCSRYSVPYLWGTVGIAYRGDKVLTPPQSWSDLIDPDPALIGHIGMMEDSTDTLVPALILLGESIATSDTKVLRQAFDMLTRQLPSVLTYSYLVTFVRADPRSDELYMALAYSGDQHDIELAYGGIQLASSPIGSGPSWRYAVPREGTILWVDCLAVIDSSPKRQLAIDFVNFLNEPEIAALNAESMMLATPNRAAMEYLSKDFRENKDVFPDREVIENSQFYQVLDESNTTLRSRIVQALIKRHESQ